MKAEFAAWYLAEMIEMFGAGIRAQAELNLAWSRDDGSFADPMLRLGLLAWQASREALVIELPKVVGFEGAYDSLQDHEFCPCMGDVSDADEVFSLCRAIEVREVIEAAGLKVKP